VQKLEQAMDALAREYAESHDPEIIAEMLELSRRLREIEGKSKLHWKRGSLLD
jgi:hypothetical protein